MDESQLMRCFDAEMVWSYTVTHSNTGNFRITAKLQGLLADQSGVDEVTGEGDSLGEAVVGVGDWLVKLAREAECVAQRDLKRLQGVLA